MNGHFLSEQALNYTGTAIDFVDHKEGVQFIHRNLAWLVAIAFIAFAYRERKNKALHGADRWLFGAVVLQFTLGIVTLIYQVPIVLGVLHQFGAVLLLGAAQCAAQPVGRPERGAGGPPVYDRSRVPVTGVRRASLSEPYRKRVVLSVNTIGLATFPYRTAFRTRGHCPFHPGITDARPWPRACPEGVRVSITAEGRPDLAGENTLARWPEPQVMQQAVSDPRCRLFQASAYMGSATKGQVPSQLA
jgi:hypothetical protein